MTKTDQGEIMRSLSRTRAFQALRERQRARLSRKPEKVPTKGWINRLQFAFYSGVMGLLLGGIFDFLTSLIRTFTQPNGDGQFIWFLAYIFAGLGALLGFTFGARAGELYAQIFAADDHGSSSAASELIRLIAKTLLVAALIWCVLLIFT